MLRITLMRANITTRDFCVIVALVIHWQAEVSHTLMSHD